jgi:protocatechuate 3,4-dioxygenase beta subunit
MRDLPGRCAGGALFLLALIHSGCGDGDGTYVPPRAGLLWGSVSSIETEPPTPVAGAQVALVDFDFTVVAGPVSTDSAGVYRLYEPPPGTYATFIFHSGLFLFDRSQSTVTVSDGDTVRQDFRLIRSDLFPTSGGYKVRGRVTDEDDGDPVAGALVEALFSGWPSDHFAGLTLPDQAVTDDSGFYYLERVFAIQDLETFEYVALGPLSVSKEGYAVFHSGLNTLPTTPDSTTVLDIELNHAGPTGSLRGRVLFDGVPMSGIRVAVDVADTSLFDFYGARKELVPVLGKIAITNHLGIYTFTGLTPGLYTVDAAYLSDDGYVEDLTEDAQVTLRSGESIAMPDLRLLKGIRPILPPPGAEVVGPVYVFQWDPVETAEYYKLWITPGHSFNSSVTVNDSARWVFDSPQRLSAPDAHLRWYVDAFRADTLIGTFETISTFTTPVDTPAAFP